MLFLFSVRSWLIRADHQAQTVVFLEALGNHDTHCAVFNDEISIVLFLVVTFPVRNRVGYVVNDLLNVLFVFQTPCEHMAQTGLHVSPDKVNVAHVISVECGLNVASLFLDKTRNSPSAGQSTTFDFFSVKLFNRLCFVLSFELTF